MKQKSKSLFLLSFFGFAAFLGFFGAVDEEVEADMKVYWTATSQLWEVVKESELIGGEQPGVGDNMGWQSRTGSLKGQWVPDLGIKISCSVLGPIYKHNQSSVFKNHDSI